MTLAPCGALIQRSKTRNVAPVAATKRRKGTIALRDRVLSTGPASTTAEPAATKTDGFEAATATGPSAARAHRNRTRPGVRTHSTVRPMNARATRKSVAYGLASPPWRIDVYPTARIPTAVGHAMPSSNRLATCRKTNIPATAAAAGTSLSEGSLNPSTWVTAFSTHRKSTGQTCW